MGVTYRCILGDKGGKVGFIVGGGGYVAMGCETGRSTEGDSGWGG